MLYIQPTYKTIAWLSLLTLQVLRQVEENLKQFNANYMILKDYFCEVEDKLKSLCQQVSQVLLYTVKSLQLDWYAVCRRPNVWRGGF